MINEMKIKKIYGYAVLLTLAFCASARAEIGAGFGIGAGIRALAFANNHAAAVNDLSAAYWNPAALGLLPVREFQLTFDGLRVTGASDMSGGGLTVPAGAVTEDYIERLRLSGAGWMFAIPTKQGGLSLALSFDRPFAFDNISVYEFEGVTEDGDRYASRQRDRRYGDLNRWTGAFGVQVTPQISAGLAVSLVTGKETAPMVVKTITDAGIYLNNDSLVHYSKYLGYALTGGFMYYPIDILRIGLRVNASMSMGVNESWGGTQLIDGEIVRFNPKYDKLESDAYTAPNGTIGAALNLPWLTATADFRVTMPYTFVLPADDIPDETQAKYYKCGAGIGFEVPIPNAPVVLRAGYSFDEYDLYSVVHKFDDEYGVDWYNEGSGYAVDRNKHTFALGGAVFTSGLGLELAYAYQTWGVTASDYWYKLERKHTSHRVATAIIFRY